VLSKRLAKIERGDAKFISGAELKSRLQR